MKPKMRPGVSNARAGSLSGRKHGRAAREDDGDGEDALTVALARRAAKSGPMAAPPTSRPPIRPNHPMRGREDVSSEEEEEEEAMGRGGSSDSDGDEEPTLGHSRERSLQDQVRTVVLSQSRCIPEERGSMSPQHPGGEGRSLFVADPGKPLYTVFLPIYPSMHPSFCCPDPCGTMSAFGIS